MANANLVSQWGQINEIFGENHQTDPNGEVIYVEDATYEQLSKAKEKAPDFWDDEYQFNDAPSQKEFLDFLKANPQFKAEVYLVSPVSRSDYRIEICGVRALNNDKNTSILYNWVNSLEDAYEPTEYGEQDSDIRAWWD